MDTLTITDCITESKRTSHSKHSKLTDNCISYNARELSFFLLNIEVHVDRDKTYKTGSFRTGELSIVLAVSIAT